MKSKIFKIGKKYIGEWAHGVRANSGIVIFINGDQCLLKSDAALTLASYLKAPWSWIRYLIYLPRFLRDPVYDWVARNRDHWFGRNTSCMVPSSELRERFLDE